MSPVLGSTLTSMIVSVRLPPPPSGRSSAPSTSTLKGPSATFPPPPNILWTQLVLEASSRSGPCALSPAGSYASAPPPGHERDENDGQGPHPPPPAGSNGLFRVVLEVPHSRKSNLAYRPKQTLRAHDN